MSFSKDVKAELLSHEKKSFKGKDAAARKELRELYLKNGSMSDPEKAYHFEIVCKSPEEAGEAKALINTFPVHAKIVPRKDAYIVYLKEGDEIVTMLGAMGASAALMKFENVRILKEMRNSVNRQVNCETANIKKTVGAAVRQTEAIRYIESTVGLSALPESLRETAYLRLKYPEVPLKDLGEMLSPPVGKSGVNHRLRRILAYADSIKGGI